MKTRVTFRVEPDIAEALRELPNQTQFVEEVLREALGMTCPVCAGAGRVREDAVALPNFKAASLPTLDPGSARQLRALVGIARRLAATQIDLARANQGLDFSVLRRGDVLLRGRVESGATTMQPS